MKSYLNKNDEVVVTMDIPVVLTVNEILENCE